MTAKVPYLSALTRPASAQPTLRPPRRLFAGQAGPAPLDVLPPPMPATPERPGPEAPATPRPATAGAGPNPATADVAREPTDPGARPPAAPPQTSARPPARPPAATSEPAGPGQPVSVPTAPLLTPGPAPDDEPLPPRRPEISTLAVPGGPPQSWADPRWALPVELPQPFWPKDSPGPVHPPEPGHPASQSPSDRHQPTPVLTPSPSDAEPAFDNPRLSEPGAGRRRARTGGTAQVSIGTIEVTVVPPAPPAAPPPPFPPVRRDRPRPVSPAASPAADRLRDGLRRWHGTAQG